MFPDPMRNLWCVSHSSRYILVLLWQSRAHCCATDLVSGFGAGTVQQW